MAMPFALLEMESGTINMGRVGAAESDKGRERVRRAECVPTCTSEIASEQHNRSGKVT